MSRGLRLHADGSFAAVHKGIGDVGQVCPFAEIIPLAKELTTDG